MRLCQTISLLFLRGYANEFNFLILHTFAKDNGTLHQCPLIIWFPGNVYNPGYLHKSSRTALDQFSGQSIP